MIDVNEFYQKRGNRSSPDYWYELKGHDDRVEPARAKELKEKGFFAAADLWYDFDKYGFDLYANDRDFFYMHPINGWFSKLVDDKRFIPVLFRNTPHYIPELSIGIEKREVRYIIESGRIINSSDTLKDVAEYYLGRFKKLFVKPAGLSGGRGAFSVNSKTLLSSIKNIHKDHAYIISNYLENEKYAENINPQNLNTLRAYFYRNKKSGLKFLTILHRFGTLQSGVIDNVGSGGMACEVDILTGKLSKAFAPMQEKIWHDYHVDTNHILTDYVIPGWDEKHRQLQEILDNLFFLDFGALDVAPTPQGLKILEINTQPSRRLIQCYKPAFLNEDFKEFCISKGYKG